MLFRSIPEHQAIHYQSLRNRQGRREEEVPPELRGKVLEILAASQQQLYGEYEKMLESDIARELARINLPLSLYTEWYWKIDLHNLFHFLRLRLDAHAQHEIRVYAEAIGTIARALVPMAWEAFEDYILEAKSFSRLELQVIAEHLETEQILKESLEAKGFGKREADEFLQKLATIANVTAKG